MTRDNALKAAALKGSIQTVCKLVEALNQQRVIMQQQLDELLEE